MTKVTLTWLKVESVSKTVVVCVRDNLSDGTDDIVSSVLLCIIHEVFITNLFT